MVHKISPISNFRRRKFFFRCIALLIAHSLSTSIAVSQESKTSAAPPTAEQNLATAQQQIAEQVTRLEALLLRSSDIEAVDNPTRAALLQQAVALSKQAQLADTLLKASQNLSANQLSEAIEQQKISRNTLKRLLELLQSENREQRVREQRDQVRRWIEETDRLLRMQQSLRGRTEGGLDPEQAAQDQSKLSEKAKSISSDLGIMLGDAKQAEGDEANKDSEASQESKSSDSKPDGNQSDGNESGEEEKKSGEENAKDSSNEGLKGGQPQTDGSDSQSDGKGSENESADAKPADREQSDTKQSDGEQSEGEPNGSQQSDSKQSSDQQSKGQQQPGQQQSGEQSSQEQQSSQPQSPTERAQQRIQQAQQNMRQAREELDKAQRDGAIEKQREAEQNLKEAIEQLEEILNQLREEEIKRSLETLESRLRRMLDQQNKVVEETTRLHELAGDQPDRQVLSRAAVLAVDQQKVGTEGQRALLLLKEEGSSAAFPEALEQVNRDIASSAMRLESGDLSKVTLIIQGDIVQALEEMVEATSKIRQENDKKQQQQQQRPGGQPMSPGEQPLIDKLAELRLIRTLQLRVNKRTETLSTMLEDPTDPVGQAHEADLVGELKELSKRQESIEQVTRNIAQQ